MNGAMAGLAGTALMGARAGDAHNAPADPRAAKRAAPGNLAAGQGQPLGLFF